MIKNITIEDAKKQKEGAGRAILSILKNLREETGLELDSISFEALSVDNMLNDDFYIIDKVSIELKL